MSKWVVPLVGVGLICLAPIFAANRSVSISKDIVSKTLINKEFTVKVNDISKSDSGFVTCKYYIEQTSKELIGPCTTTSNKRLDVGRSYTVSSASVDKDFLVINDAKLIDGMIRRRVVRVYHVGWTRMAELDNGDKIGGDNVAVDEWISIE